MTSFRGPDATFWFLVERLLEKKEHIGKVGLYWVKGGDWRLTAEPQDERRDLDLPGQRQEPDELDFDVSDTDVD